MNFYEKLKLIHNVKCPVCGSKPDFIITGNNTYKTETCGHIEIQKIITERERLVFTNKINPENNQPIQS